jgi:hypothetical protein
MKIIIETDDSDFYSSFNEFMEDYWDSYDYYIKHKKIFPDDNYNKKRIKKKYILNFERKLNKLLKNKNRELYL